MVNLTKRRKLAQAMIRFMRAEFKAEQFRIFAFDSQDKHDTTLMEISYKAMKDCISTCDHYIKVINEDWHFWVQMITFLHTNRTVKKFHVHNPNPQTAKFLTIGIFGVFIPAAFWIAFCVQNPDLAASVFLMPIVLIPINILIARLFNRNSNFEPDVKLPHYWPYKSQADFEADFEAFGKDLNIPPNPPDLTGKVAKVNNLLWETPRPDE